MTRALLIFPMTYEAEETFKFFGINRYPKEGDFETLSESENLKISALVSGFGCAATNARIEKAIKQTQPNTVILAGCCGACSANIKAGEFLFETNSDKIKNYLLNHGFKSALFECVDHIAGEDEKHAANKNKGALGIEMESSLVRRNTVRYAAANAQFAHIRIVSDGTGAELPMAFLASIMNFENGHIEVSKKRTLIEMLKNPTLIWKLPKFAKSLIPVQKKYNEFLRNEFLPKIEELVK